MVNIFNEVDEDIRKEKYKKLWSKYGKYLIGFILSIVVIFSLSQYFETKKIADNQILLEIYFTAAENIEKNQFELANKDLDKVYNDKNLTLSAFSGFKLAENHLKNNDKNQAIVVLKKILNNNSLETIYRELALYKYIMINFDDMTINDIENKTKIIDTKDSELNPYFKELLGIKYISMGDKNSALLIFNELSSLESTPLDLKIRLEKLTEIAS